MLIKEQIHKFLTNEKIEIIKDGDTHFLSVSSWELPICVVNSTNYAYGNKEYIKSLSSLHSVPKALVKEVFTEWLQSKFDKELKDVTFIGSPLYKFLAKQEIPYPN
jgi:hypothetical protein